MALKFHTDEYEREAELEERRLTQQGTQNPLVDPNIIAAMKKKEEREQMMFQQQLAQGIPQEGMIPPTGKISFGSRLMQGAKNKLLGFHYSMLERKRQNALMKQQNPQAYTKMVAERKERYNIMNQPNLFDGRGRMKW